MTLTAEQLQMRARDAGLDPTINDCENALNPINQDKLKQDRKDELSYEIWDRQSPINGTPAEDVLEQRDDIPEEGAVYLVKDETRENEVLLFQPHNPDVEGHVGMGEAEANRKGRQHVDHIAESHADAEALRRGIENLRE